MSRINPAHRNAITNISLGLVFKQHNRYLPQKTFKVLASLSSLLYLRLECHFDLGWMEKAREPPLDFIGPIARAIAENENLRRIKRLRGLRLKLTLGRDEDNEDDWYSEEDDETAQADINFIRRVFWGAEKDLGEALGCRKIGVASNA